MEVRLDVPLPSNEAQRLRALEEYEIVGSEPEQAFDDLAELAAQLCGCPLGYVNLITEKHRWMKACYGLPVSLVEAPRAASSCQWTVCQSDVIVVPDMTQDARFCDLPYVTGPPHLRFYAGAPLINPQGYALGTICVGDFETRQLRPDQVEALRRLARQAVGQLELRRQVIALRRAEQALTEQKQRADELLLSILPSSIADELLVHQKVEPRYHESVTVLFADFKDFTTFAENMEPRAVIDDLDRYFCAFDDIATGHGLETLKTIGDAYMAVGGLPIPNRTHPVDACLAGLAIQDHVARANIGRQKLRMPPWELRVGIHTGGVMAGVVGRRKFTYDVWGDAVNVAARMESSGEAGRVNISEATWHHVSNLFEAEARGRIEAKHKGTLAMFFLTGIRPELASDPEGRVPGQAFVAALRRMGS
jgi:class 3 adenylate cyclase